MTTTVSHTLSEINSDLLITWESGPGVGTSMVHTRTCICTVWQLEHSNTSINNQLIKIKSLSIIHSVEPGYIMVTLGTYKSGDYTEVTLLYSQISM